ncbi:MAG TPA: hypothetical protein DCZ76_11175 [Treponema sp.]|nr:hypothetical protein [Treponema sp.]
MCRVLAIYPTPDWKGGVAVAKQWRGVGPPEPWKAGKNRLLAIFTHKFPAETCSIFIANRRCALRGAIGLQMGKNCMEFDRTRRAGHSKKRNAVRIKKKF